ncbi:hypothetical protein EYC95_28180 [Pseudomonas sp. BGI-2]|nr:hypothetical protein EYC95_28180 [Pseudomonas sp. BGI-2]
MGVCDDAFASKPAPTLDLCTAQNLCGSGLAREEALKLNANFKKKHPIKRPRSIWIAAFFIALD